MEEGELISGGERSGEADGGGVGLSGRVVRLLSVPDGFRRAALEFPRRVDEALSLTVDAAGASRLLDRADALAHYARRVKADTEIVNSIQYGKLKIVARLGELMPVDGKGGRGKKTGKGALPVSKPTISNYRKVSRHCGMIQGYYEEAREATESGDLVEMSISGFITYCGADGNIKAHQNKGLIEWYTPAEYVEAAREVMGRIDVDPASSAYAQRVVKAETFYTVKKVQRRSIRRGTEIGPRRPGDRVLLCGV